MDLNLTGKLAVITGGSKGIGFAIAEGLAREGVDIILISRNKKKLEEAKNKLVNNYGIKVIGISADLTEVDEINQAVSIIKNETEKIDILINNAGTGSNETIMEANDEKWNYYWNLHVMAIVRLSRALVPLMKKNGGGVILNTSSICAKQPLGYEPIYNTTKAALTMLSKGMANEFIKDDIRVNSINPGLILTEDWINTATKLTEGTEKYYQDYLDDIAEKNTPIKRFASPEELANFYVFMCSDKASYCVGSSYYVDGGWLETTI